MASASEAAVTIGGAPNLAFLVFQHLVSGDYHLRYSLAVRDDDGFTAVVLHQHTPFAVVIRIDRAGRVRNHQRRLEAGATPGPYLSLVANRKRVARNPSGTVARSPGSSSRTTPSPSGSVLGVPSYWRPPRLSFTIGLPSR